jgi:hypothetical protein
MQTKDFRYFIIISCAILLLAGCDQLNQLLPNEELDFTVQSFINSIKCDNATADFQKEKLPCDTSVATPYISLQSWVVKGKDIAISVTLPDDATEIYIAATNAQADYLDLHLEGKKQDSIIGYYRLPLTGLKSLRSTQTQLLKKANVTSYKNYVLVLSSNEDIQVSKFVLHASYKTPQGISNAAVMPVDVVSIAPYQKQLRVGFRPLKDYSYTITINIPDGKKITYNYNKTSGAELFDNTQSPLSKLSYDQELDVNWIDIDPVFGNYTMDTNISIQITDASQEIVMLFLVYSEGKIDQMNLNAVIQYDGGSMAFGKATLSFGYLTKFKYYYSVSGNVPPISQQPFTKGCWATSITMLMSWNDNKIYTTEQAMSMIGQYWYNLYIYNKGLNISDGELLIVDTGLVAERNYSPLPQGIFSLLKEYGPIIVSTKSGLGLHDRVITGIYGDGSFDNTMLRINDPWDGTSNYESFQTFIDSYAQYEGHAFQISHFPKESL